MAKQRETRKRSPKSRVKPGVIGLETWKLEDAKARFSEVVRLAETNGPQLVTVRGKQAAVIISPSEFLRLRPAKKQQSLVDFLQGLNLGEVPLVREPDAGRDIDL
jgi:prevent-host-death family protein